MCPSYQYAALNKFMLFICIPHEWEPLWISTFNTVAKRKKVILSKKIKLYFQLNKSNYTKCAEKS